ncbi:MAG TPA: HEAT repeat domain-containing protein [Gemmataceae bacterium]|jgi:HEAT repeat protein
MKNCPTLAGAALFLGIALADLALAGPISREESQRQAQVVEQLKKVLAEESANAAKFTYIAGVMKDERNVDLRRRILDTATQIRGPDLEVFLTKRLTLEEDAGLRSQAATTLGQIGSEKCLTTLAQVAGNDRTTPRQIGCVIGRSSARRAATFAIAELATRFPKLADRAAAELRALPVVVNAKDNESLADARVQALYQITHDKALLKPYYEQLKSNNPLDRARGIASFRFLKLKEAPAEIIDSLKDASSNVRSESASVLGEIRDPKTAAALMRVAGDTKEEATVRCNAIYALGRMKTAKAADLMEKLLTDPKPIVQANAAIALYRITGKKVKQFPEGYNAD